MSQQDIIATIVALAVLVALVSFIWWKRRPAPRLRLLDPRLASSWEVGPIVKGERKSKGTPLHPIALPEGLAIDVPLQGQGKAGYVTFPHGGLVGKRWIALTYHLELAPGAELQAFDAPPGTPATLSLFLQRHGDDWTGKGRMRGFRWWHGSEPLRPGVHQVRASLDDPWTDVMGASSHALGNLTSFLEAKADAERVGFTLGGGGNFGHGIFATGQARLTIISFEVV